MPVLQTAARALRQIVQGFIGPSNIQRATNQDIEETINWYVESTEPGTGKTTGGLLPTPGLVPFAQVNDSPGSAIFYQDGSCWVIVGSTFAAVNSDGTTNALGTVAAATSALPSSIVSNGSAGHQLLLCSGGQGYVWDTTANTLTVINSTNFPGTGFPTGTAQQVEFMDGYGIVLVQNSRKFFLSASEDFTSWDPLDVAERSEASDNIQTMRRNKREIVFLGTKTGEVWYDSGDALFPFAPVPGAFIESGSASVSCCRISGTIAWLSLNERGFGVVNLLDGYDAKPIGTPAIDRYLQSAAQLASAKLFAQQQEGHTFLWIKVSDLDTTPCFDYSTGVWHKRALWDTTACVWTPHLASGQAFAFNKHLILDDRSGIIYSLSMSAYTDSVV